MKNDKQVQHAKHPGDTTRPVRCKIEGTIGLHLQITHKGSKSWLLRYRVNGKSREQGLGSYPAVSLADARKQADTIRGEVASQVDPIAKREAEAREQARLNYTFTQAMDDYEEVRLNANMSDKDRKQWRRSLELHALPHLGKLRVQDISVADIEKVLLPIWTTKHVMAKRVCSRVRVILNRATAKGFRSEDRLNPADLRGPLKDVLPEHNHQERHQPALSVALAPAWFAHLRQLDGNGSRALEFVMLTAARSGEVRGATWGEVDLASGMWIVPKERMKMKRPHRVPLSAPALALLEAMPRTGALVFPAVRGGMLSDMTLSATMRRMSKANPEYGDCVPHGLRATFKTWASDLTSYENDMSEIALAHKVGTKAEQAYRRGSMVEKRRDMMQAWADYLTDA